MEGRAPSSKASPTNGSRAVSANQDASQSGQASQLTCDQLPVDENSQQKEVISKAFQLLDEEQCGRVMAE